MLGTTVPCTVSVLKVVGQECFSARVSKQYEIFFPSTLFMFEFAQQANVVAGPRAFFLFLAGEGVRQWIESFQPQFVNYPRR